MMTPRLNKIKIDHDNEKLRDIFKGYAILGYSITFTARCVGISKSYAQELCQIYGMRKFFDSKNYVKECKGGPSALTWRGGWPKGRKRK